MSIINETEEQSERTLREARTFIGSSEVFDKYLKAYRLQAFQHGEFLMVSNATQREIDISAGRALAASDMYAQLFGEVK